MVEKKSFKTKWEETDIVCPVCNQVTERKRGLTRQNVKNLFKKPTLQDIILLVLILLTILGAYAYTQEVAQYKEIIRDPQELCEFYWENIQHGNFGEEKIIQYSVDYNLSSIPTT